MFSLTGKAVAILGAESKAGQTAARRFARAGAKLALADNGDLSELAKATGGVFFKSDLTRESEVGTLLEKVKAGFGKLDIVVNIPRFENPAGAAHEVTSQALDDELNSRLKPTVWSLKHAKPRISKNGSIINVADVSYNAVAEAIAGITKSAALEFAEKGIRVNCICGRADASAEIAALSHFLADDDSSFITGIAVPAAPGMAVAKNSSPASPDFSLQGKVAVVTGAASGLGKATALRFAKAGAKVAIADISDGDAVAKAAGGIFVKTDVSDEEQVRTLLEKTVSSFGGLDILVNNAGIEGKDQEIKDIEPEELEHVLSNNFKSAAYGIRHAVPLMKHGGAILSTASYAGLFGTPMYGNYIMSKAGIIGLTRQAAAELKDQNIRVNCICPGTMDTPMIYKSDQASAVELALAKKLQPLGRLGQPEDAAALFHFLASDEGAFLTGQALPLDGGMSAGPGYGVVGPLYALTLLRLMPLIDLLVKWFK